jgi:tetratricopeptide (TPR) repeat protein
MKPERWLATVLFTDIVSSTERAAELGDRQWRELLQQHHALVRRELARFGGRELNMTGDGFLATFERPEQAIRGACAIRDAVRRLGLEIRSGLHTGEVELIEKTVGGIAVHTGARVAAQAGPGEVLVSSTLRDLVAGSGFEFEDRGTHALKGVPGEWRLLAVTSAPLRLPVSSFWSRAREARLPRILLAYLGASALLLWLTIFLRDQFQLPGWMLAAVVVLLLIGLVIISATAWVQSHPLTPVRAEREEVPGSWELDLREMRQSVARGRLPHLTWGRSILGGIVAFSLLFGLAGAYVLVQDRGRSFSPREAVAEAAAPGIAVLPFDVRGPGLDVWREGMVDLFSTNLDGISGLRAIESRTVLARWDEVVQGTGRPDLATALEVARQAGARYALIGSAVAIGPDVRLGADVYEVEGGRSLGQSQVEGPPDSVLALVDRLSIEVLREIVGEEASELPHVNLARATTTSLPALKAYLEGEVLYRRSDFEGAIPPYVRALEADSTFALAAARLAIAYGWTESILSEVGSEYNERAARLAGRLPEREAVLVRAGQALFRGTLDGVEPLQQAVRKYPDDVEAWHLLGETYFHLGEHGLVTQGESEQAFAKAVELDPTFAPAYIHLMDHAFVLHADSARAARHLQTYERLTGGEGADIRRQRFAFQLVFGQPESRTEARAALDTLPGRTLLLLALQSLWHVRTLPLQEDVLTALSSQPDERRAQLARVLLYYNYVERGKLRAALEVLDDPQLSEGFAPEGLYFAYVAGLPVPPERLEREVSLGPADTLPQQRDFFAGGYAADRGNWRDHDAALERLRGATRGSMARGDSTGARYYEGLSHALEGYGLWKRGRVEEGERLLVSGQRQATGHAEFYIANGVIRRWLGQLFLEKGRPQEAERYFRSFWQSPLAAYELAKVYEELEQYSKAREAYEIFATAWRDADPELQSRVEEARAAANRLTSVIRE